MENSDQGRCFMAEDEVGGTIEEAKQSHAAKAEDPGATTGQANEPPSEGHVPPEAGSDSAPASEIPVGVDALTDEQIAKAEEAGPAAGGGEEGDGGALDVAALMEEDGGATADDAVSDEQA
jgi:hypothetical protein